MNKLILKRMLFILFIILSIQFIIFPFEVIVLLGNVPEGMFELYLVDIFAVLISLGLLIGLIKK